MSPLSNQGNDCRNHSGSQLPDGSATLYFSGERTSTSDCQIYGAVEIMSTSKCDRRAPSLPTITMRIEPGKPARTYHGRFRRRAQQEQERVDLRIEAHLHSEHKKKQEAARVTHEHVATVEPREERIVRHHEELRSVRLVTPCDVELTSPQGNLKVLSTCKLT